MSPHQSKTGVYVFFFCISRKVNSCFCVCFFFLFFVLSLVASLFLFLSSFLSFSRKPFSFPPLSVCSLFFFCVDHCVARARKSVSPEIGGLLSPLPTPLETGPCQKRGEMHTHTPGIAARSIGNIAEGKRRKMHFTGCGWCFLWVGCACVFGAWFARVGRGTVVARNRKCPYLGF